MKIIFHRFFKQTLFRFFGGGEIIEKKVRSQNKGKTLNVEQKVQERADRILLLLFVLFLK